MRGVIHAAALLHDVGDPPLSHSSEPAFKEAFGLDHHGTTRDIIMGRGELGAAVQSVLRMHGIDGRDVAQVVFDETDEVDWFFGGPINFDTIEGIHRVLYRMEPNGENQDPATVVDAAIRRETAADRQTVDRFWSDKGRAYGKHLGSADSVAADLICQAAVLHSAEELDRGDFLSTDADLFAKLPELRKTLASEQIMDETHSLLQGHETYTARTYTVDEAGDFHEGEDRERYKVAKHPLQFVEVVLRRPNRRWMSERGHV